VPPESSGQRQARPSGGAWIRLPPSRKPPGLGSARLGLGLFLCGHFVAAYLLRPLFLLGVCEHLYVQGVTLFPTIVGFVVGCWLSIRIFRSLRRKHRGFLGYRSTRCLVVLLILVHVVEIGWFGQAVVRVLSDTGGSDSAYRMCYPDMYH